MGAQQQFEQMLASGELQEQLQVMAMEMLESGQLEKMTLEFLQSPQTELMVDELVAEVMRPPTEEEMAQMQQVWTEMMSSMMSEEELAQMQQSWEDWESNGGLMGTMMGMDGGMAELLGL